MKLPWVRPYARPRRFLWVSLTLLAVSGCRVACEADPLLGVWEVIRVRNESATDSEEVRNPGPSVVIITPNYYSQLWIPVEGSIQSFATPWHPTQEEMLRRYGEMIVNAGTYSRGDTLLLTHPIISRVPDLMGGAVTYSYRTGADTLWLTALDEVSADGLRAPWAEAGIRTTLVLTKKQPSSGEAIAFYSDRDGNPEIYLMRPDGTGQRRVTRHPAFDVGPAMSPDGRSIVFLSGRNDAEGSPPEFNWEVYSVRVDGTGLRRLTENNAPEDHLDWSPDGNRISFNADYDGDGLQEIYTMSPDGADLRRLTHGPANDQWASWSPDGRHLVFTSDRGGGLDLWAMEADGSGQRLVIGDSLPELFPEWSPDGRRIAYMVLDDGPQVWMADSDGGNPREVMTGRGEDPIWSPGGNSIVFQDWNHGAMEIFRVILATGEIQNLTRNPANDFWPSWE